MNTLILAGRSIQSKKKLTMHAFIQQRFKNRDYRFWACQLSGWAGYSLATFLSITVVDGNVSWDHVGHISLSAVLGVLCSWPLRPLYRASFALSLTSRVVISVLALVAISAVWTVLRVVIYAWMIGESAIWAEVNYWFFGSLFVFLSWTALYYGIKYYELLTEEHQKLVHESAQKELEHFRRMRAESTARQAQLQMLRYQLNPHFLFNTMNAINALVELGENNKAQQMIQLLSSFLRHSLEQESLEHISLEEELESLMLYLEIEKARFEDRLTLEFDIAEEARTAKVPPLLLQPLIENSMKYAIALNEDGGKVSLGAEVRDGYLYLELADTGPGPQGAIGDGGTGVGLANTRDRLSALYGDRGSLNCSPYTDEGSTTVIRIPFEQDMEPMQRAGGDS